VGTTKTVSEAVKPVAAAPSVPKLSFPAPLASIAPAAASKTEESQKKHEDAHSGEKAAEQSVPAAAAAPASSGLWGKRKTGWSCSTCLVENAETLEKCAACGAAKPGMSLVYLSC
jgi:hypothetical protein